MRSHATPRMTSRAPRARLRAPAANHSAARPSNGPLQRPPRGNRALAPAPTARLFLLSFAALFFSLVLVLFLSFLFFPPRNGPLGPPQPLPQPLPVFAPTLPDWEVSLSHRSSRDPGHRHPRVSVSDCSTYNTPHFPRYKQTNKQKKHNQPTHLL